MPKAIPEYRTDHLACLLNAGKLDQVRKLVIRLRQVAGREAAWQWRYFQEGGWKGFQSMAKAGWSRPWIDEGVLNTTFSQLVMSQVAGSLQGYFGNVQNTYTRLVSGSRLPDPIRHQLHVINRRQAWFWKCDVKVLHSVVQTDPKTGKPRLARNGQPVSRDQDVIVSSEVRALARTLIRKALSLHRKPHFRRFQPQLDQRVCFLQAAHTSKHPTWLAMSTGQDKTRIYLPLHTHAHFLERNGRSTLYQALARVAAKGPPPQGPEQIRQAVNGHGTAFLDHMRLHDAKLDQNGNSKTPPKVSNPHPTDLSTPNTVRLLLSEDQQALTVGVVSDMRDAFDHDSAVYAPLSERLTLDLGLCNLIATADGELHGRHWMQTLEGFDRLLTSIARHRQRLGLKTASDRYRYHVSRLRGWLKTELHRILNALVARKRPARIVIEDTDFYRSPKLSRRLNRLVSNFGRGIFTAKLAEFERRYGITIERRPCAYTSQQCASCGYVDKRNRTTQSRFHCKFCGNMQHADIQAARVLDCGRSAVNASSPMCHPPGRKRLLVDLVCQFNARYTRPRGGPADPRFTNPYFSPWAQAHRETQASGCWAEVNSGLGHPLKDAA